MSRPIDIVIKGLASYNEARRVERDPRTTWKLAYSWARECARQNLE
jgi:hypothetical protein